MGTLFLGRDKGLIVILEEGGLPHWLVYSISQAAFFFGC